MTKELEKQIDKFRNFKFEGTTLESLDRLENIRSYWQDILGLGNAELTQQEMEANMDTIFKSVFLSEDCREGKLTDEKYLLVRTGIEEKKVV